MVWLAMQLGKKTALEKKIVVFVFKVIRKPNGIFIHSIAAQKAANLRV